MKKGLPGWKRITILTQKKMKIKMLFIFIFLTGCTANHHLRQAEKHLKKAEILGAKIKADTVFKNVEVIMPVVKIDTIIQRVTFRDTIELWKDRFHVKIKIDTVHKSVFVHGVCQADTVIVKVPVIVNNRIKSKIPWRGIAISTFIFLLLFVTLFRRK